MQNIDPLARRQPRSLPRLPRRTVDTDRRTFCPPTPQGFDSLTPVDRMIARPCFADAFYPMED